jgi:hypothetical protein
MFIHGSSRNVVRSRRNPKDAGELSSRHELLMEIESNCHPGKLILASYPERSASIFLA